MEIQNLFHQAHRLLFSFQPCFSAHIHVLAVETWIEISCTEQEINKKKSINRVHGDVRISRVHSFVLMLP